MADDQKPSASTPNETSEKPESIANSVAASDVPESPVSSSPDAGATDTQPRPSNAAQTPSAVEVPSDPPVVDQPSSPVPTDAPPVSPEIKLPPEAARVSLPKTEDRESTLKLPVEQVQATPPGSISSQLVNDEPGVVPAHVRVRLAPSAIKSTNSATGITLSPSGMFVADGTVLGSFKVVVPKSQAQNVEVKLPSTTPDAAIEGLRRSDVGKSRSSSVRKPGPSVVRSKLSPSSAKLSESGNQELTLSPSGIYSDFGKAVLSFRMVLTPSQEVLIDFHEDRQKQKPKNPPPNAVFVGPVRFDFRVKQNWLPKVSRISRQTWN